MARWSTLSQISIKPKLPKPVFFFAFSQKKVVLCAVTS